MSPSLAIVLTVVMVLANAFFVAFEFAFVKIRPTRLQQLAAEGRGPARLLLRMTKQINHYLSTCQIGITVASLVLGWLGEPAVAKLVGPFFERHWNLEPATIHTMSAALSLATI